VINIKSKVFMIFLIIFGPLIALLLIVFLVFLSSSDRGLIFQRESAINYGGQERHYLIEKPSDYDSSKSYPLLVVLHGFRDRGKQIGLYAGTNNLAQEKDVIVVYPRGLNRSWNGQVCCGFSYQNQIDDLGFINALIDEISNKYSIDTNKIDVIGYSNGGLLAQKLLHQYPDRFRAGAAVMIGAGTPEQSLDISNAKAPFILVNGGKDNYVALTADQTKSSGFRFLSAEQSIELWAKQYQASNPTTTTSPGGYTKTTYKTNNGSLEHVVYKENGHVWPEWRVNKPWVKIPSSTKLIYDFFENSNQ
jgi:polyhydroxybutyrate depolymerase